MIHRQKKTQERRITRVSKIERNITSTKLPQNDPPQKRKKTRLEKRIKRRKWKRKRKVEEKESEKIMVDLSHFKIRRKNKVVHT